MKKYLFLLLALPFAVGCKQSVEPNRLLGVGKIDLQAQIGATKATGSSTTAGGVWEAGDAIGMYISSENYIQSNLQYVYDGTSSAFKASAGELTYNSYANHDVFGYYPYVGDAPGSDLAATVLQFEVKADQVAAGAYTLSDLMYGKTVNQVPQVSGYNPVKVVFEHKLSNVRVKLRNRGGAAFVGVAMPVVRMNSTNRAAILNLSNGVALVNTEAPSVGSILMQPGKCFDASGVEVAYSSNNAVVVEYVAVGVPQAVAAGSELFSVEAGGSTFVVTLSDAFIFESGKEHLYNVTNSGVDLNIGGGSIVEWGAGETGSGAVGGDGELPWKLTFSFTDESLVAGAVSAEATLDGVAYNSTKCTWDATNKKLSVELLLGSNWGNELTKLVLKDNTGGIVKSYENLTVVVLGDPTSANYKQVINL